MRNKYYRVPRDFAIWNQISFNAGTKEENIKRIYDLPRGEISNYISLVGVPALVDAQKDEKLAEVFNASTMVVVDGMPIVERARKLGLQCDRFSGPDFIEDFLRYGIDRGTRHFFYGCTDDVLEKLKIQVNIKVPGCIICGTYAPPFRELTEEEDIEVVQLIQEAKPDFLWIGLGGKKQERWMHDHQAKIKGTTMLGVGAAFNYLAGTLHEMPDWMEKHSLGWLARLVIEPKRLWRRYIIGGCLYIRYNLKYMHSSQYKDRFLRS